MSDLPAPKGWSRTTRLVLALVVALAVTAAAAVTVVRRTPARDPVVLPDAADAFGADGVLGRTVLRAAFSPSGRLLLVQTPAGIGVATGDDDTPDGDVQFLTPPGSRAVGAAWFPSETAVLVVEGPVPTGQLAVVELDGRVRGVIPLEESFSAGSGRGMAVAPDGRRAVVTAEVRDVIGGARHFHLVLVDLETGAVVDVTGADGPDETDPVFVGPDEIAYTETDHPGGASRAVVRELAAAATRPLSPDDVDARAVGVVRSAVAYVADGVVWRVDRGGPQRLATVDGDVLAVHPDGTLVVLGGRGSAQILRP
jgi:hypothetical protein